MRTLCCALAATLAAGAARASAQEPAATDSIPIYVLEPLTVHGRADDLAGLVPSASVGYVGYRDLRLRPLSREGELLETVPGMILTQHSGSGKSNQMFVRGFNLDHGTDFATWLDGMPVNIPGHAHGQGYTDLNFVVPELVDHVEYSLGNYYAEIGDFGSAGAAQIRLRQRLDEPTFAVGAGSFGHLRAMAAASTRLGTGTLLAGGEVRGYDGPWTVPERLRKAAGMLRWTAEGRSSRVSVLALGYANRWDASDQVPLRAVAAGLIDRFGQIDPTLGGETSRYSLSASWSRSSGSKSDQIDVYAIRYGLDLYSNFTYALEDPVAGDQIRQQDDGRWTLGGNLTGRRRFEAGGRSQSLTVGAQLRRDQSDVALRRTDARVAVSTVRDDLVTQSSAGLFGELATSWSDVARTTVGLRADAFRFVVSSDRAANSGRAEDAIVSPKASIALGPWSGTEVYLSVGLGFHSNDGRGAVQTVDPETGDPTDPVDPLVRSRGAEVGVRSTPAPGLRSTASLWTVELDSELLFVGDAGTTEASAPSRRLGITLANFWRIAEEWTADVDVSLTRARLLDVDPAVDRVPGAMENVVAAGLSREPVGDGIVVAIRLRRFGSYPLVEDDARRAGASTMVNATLGYRLGRARVSASVLNVLDAEHSDIQYYYRSRLAAEPVEGVEDLHFHPAEPRQLRVALSWGL